MDVRAKQRLCLKRHLLNLNLRGGGFAPRHLNRYAATFYQTQELYLLALRISLRQN
jgi:hypothetical protein